MGTFAHALGTCQSSPFAEDSSTTACKLQPVAWCRQNALVGGACRNICDTSQPSQRDGRPEGTAILSGMPPRDGSLPLPSCLIWHCTQPPRQSSASAHLPDLTLQAVQCGCQNQFHQLRHVLLVGANMGQHCHRVRRAPPAGRAAQVVLLVAPCLAGATLCVLLVVGNLGQHCLLGFRLTSPAGTADRLAKAAA